MPPSHSSDRPAVSGDRAFGHHGGDDRRQLDMFGHAARNDDSDAEEVRAELLDIPQITNWLPEDEDGRLRPQSPPRWRRYRREKGSDPRAQRSTVRASGLTTLAPT